MDIKKELKRIWHFIWHDDSLLSWITTAILAFLIIKFAVYPLMGLLLGTNFPVVAVVSSSMDHKGDFNHWWTFRGEWYEDNGITKEQFQTFPMKNGFNKGDIIVLINKNPKDIKTGDVIVFKSHHTRPRPDPIIHRIVKDDGVLQTKGDSNSKMITTCSGSGCLDEKDIKADQVLGKAIFRIPFLGWIKIGFVNIFVEPYCKISNNMFPCRG